MKVLLTFVGYHDPYCPGIDGQDQEGPILTASRHVEFDAVYLFYNSNAKIEELTTKTEKALKKTQPSTKVYAICLDIKSPIDYSSIVDSLTRELIKVKRICKGATYYIAPASGTPQMHAAWIMLILSGRLDATILQTTEPRFTSDKRASVREIDIITEGYAKIDDIKESIIKAPQDNDPLESKRLELGIIGYAPGLLQALDQVRNYADTDLNILLLGETGTGKKLFAQLIHYFSKRKDNPFLSWNCAGFEDSTAVSELFGHRKGSFTGADRDHLGLFKQADGGTLFLDEFAELSKGVQAKLLKAVDEGVIEPLGKKPEYVDVRLITATNVDIEKALAGKAFREDLYQRIKQVEIELLPLRKRKGDIRILADYFLFKAMLNSAEIPKQIISFSPEAYHVLEKYSWPGNIRELKNVIDTVVVICLKKGHNVIRSGNLNISEKYIKTGLELLDPYPGCIGDLKEKKDYYFTRALELAVGNKRKAASILGINYQAFWTYIKRKK